MSSRTMILPILNESPRVVSVQSLAQYTNDNAKRDAK